MVPWTPLLLELFVITMGVIIQVNYYEVWLKVLIVLIMKVSIPSGFWERRCSPGYTVCTCVKYSVKLCVNIVLEIKRLLLSRYAEH